MGAFFNHWLARNCITLLGFALVAWVLWSGSHHERWQRAWRRFRGDKIGMAALIVTCIYLFIGALEVIHIPGGKGGSRSVIDVLFAARIPSEKT